MLPLCSIVNSGWIRAYVYATMGACTNTSPRIILHGEVLYCYATPGSTCTWQNISLPFTHVWFSAVVLNTTARERDHCPEEGECITLCLNLCSRHILTSCMTACKSVTYNTFSSTLMLYCTVGIYHKPKLSINGSVLSCLLLWRRNLRCVSLTGVVQKALSTSCHCVCSSLANSNLLTSQADRIPRKSWSV